MSSEAAERAVLRLVRWITVLAAVVGVLSALSYGSGAHMALRYANSVLGAWWDGHEFAVMEVAASALGLLIAIRIASRLVHRGTLRRRTRALSLVASAAVVVPLAHLVARLARLGFNASGPPARDYLIARGGFATGVMLDKLLIAGVYFFKMAGFAFLAGFGICAGVVAITMALVSRRAVPEESGTPR